MSSLFSTSQLIVFHLRALEIFQYRVSMKALEYLSKVVEIKKSSALSAWKYDSVQGDTNRFEGDL
jgi:hypothetical protein